MVLVIVIVVIIVVIPFQFHDWITSKQLDILVWNHDDKILPATTNTDTKFNSVTNLRIFWPSSKKYKSFSVKTLCRLWLSQSSFPLFGFHLKNVSCYFLIFRDLSSYLYTKQNTKILKNRDISRNFCDINFSEFGPD